MIDRGGTFTDIVARAPDGNLSTLKLLSALNPESVPSIEQAREIIADRERLAHELKESRDEARTEADYSRADDYVSQTRRH